MNVCGHPRCSDHRTRFWTLDAERVRLDENEDVRQDVREEVDGQEDERVPDLVAVADEIKAARGPALREAPGKHRSGRDAGPHQEHQAAPDQPPAHGRQE